MLKDDGTHIQGTLVSWTAGGLDYDKRELVLKEPLRYQPTDGKQHSLPVDMVVIAGRDIRRLDVKYLMEENRQEVGEPTGKASVIAMIHVLPDLLPITVVVGVAAVMLLSTAAVSTVRRNLRVRSEPPTGR